MERTLILASESPRRRRMLARLGVAFRTEAAALDETRLARESPPDMTVRLALLKAQTVFDRLGAATAAPAAHPAHLVLAGDTAVAIGDEILGKPADRDHAMAMLRRLSGATHTVFSAVALVAGERRAHRLSVRRAHRLSATEVTFERLDARQIETYCDSEEPFDKAGAYAIQGFAGAFVRRINGSYSGVVGLPLWETRQLLRQFDYPCERP